MVDDLTTTTVNAVPEGGITQMEPSKALSNIDSWIAKLGGASFPNADTIKSGLETLKAQLQASPRDGKAIGQSLTTLGEMTTQAGAGNDALGKLGSALSKGGRALSGQKA